MAKSIKNPSDNYLSHCWWKILGLSILILLVVAWGVAAGNMMKQANEQQMTKQTNEQQTQYINNKKCQCGCDKIDCNCENENSYNRPRGPGFRSGSAIKYGRWY